MKARSALIAVALVLAFLLTGCGMVKEAWEEGWEAGAQTPAETSAPVQVSEAFTAQEVAVETMAPQRDNPLDAIDLSAEDKRLLYDEVSAALFEAWSDGGAAAQADPENARLVEDEIIAGIASKYDVTLEEATTIYTMSSYGYLYDVDPEAISVPYGELLDVTINGTTLVLKVKISSSLTDKMTIDQNYYNVEDVIRGQGLDEFHTISYWAVADMSDGSEGKVIQFTLGKDLIQNVAAQRVLPNQLGDYVEDLWILPSLTQG